MLEGAELAGLAEGVAQRVRDLAEGAEALDTVQDQRHRIRGPACALLETLQEGPGARLVSTGAHRAEPLDLPFAHRRVDSENLRRNFGFLGLEAIHADDDPLTRLDLTLEAVRRLLNLALDEALLDCRDRSAQLIHPSDDVPGFGLQAVGQPLDVG